MIESFLLYPLLTGLVFAVLAGPLGSYMIWRRLSFFGDTLAHAGLIGISLGVLFQVGPLSGLIAVALAVAIALTTFAPHGRFSQDTLLALMSHGALALGLIFFSLVKSSQLQLTSYLLGDILAVNEGDFWVIFGVGSLILIGLGLLWRPLLAVTVSEEIASVEGIAVQRTKYLFMMMLAFTMAISLKIMGVLLITALMIIPAATARAFSKTPEQMGVLAGVIGCISVVLGFWGSYEFNLPTSASIVTSGLMLFVVTAVLKK